LRRLEHSAESSKAQSRENSEDSTHGWLMSEIYKHASSALEVVLAKKGSAKAAVLRRSMPEHLRPTIYALVSETLKYLHLQIDQCWKRS